MAFRTHSTKSLKYSIIVPLPCKTKKIMYSEDLHTFLDHHYMITWYTQGILPMHGSDTHVKNIILYNIPHKFLSWVLLISLLIEGHVACLRSHTLLCMWAYIICLFFPTILQILVLYHSTACSITPYTYIPGAVFILL